MKHTLWNGILIAVSSLALAGFASAQQLLPSDPEAPDGPSAEGSRSYEVTILNLSRGLTFTPALAVLHTDEAQLAIPGEEASEPLAALAEGGDTQPFLDALEGSDAIGDTTTGEGPIGPGESATVTLEAAAEFDRLSVAAMLLPTNDGFYAVEIPVAEIGAEGNSWVSPGWDAGAEPNDELCANIPGPDCGGSGVSPEAGGEGVVHVHSGIHGVGDLAPADYDWRNPVALITVVPTGGDEGEGSDNGDGGEPSEMGLL